MSAYSDSYGFFTNSTGKDAVIITASIGLSR